MSKARPILRIRSPVVGREEAVFELESSRVTIGRGEDCDIVLLEQAASRLHAEIRRTETGWVVSDAGSHNGVWVDGKRVTEHVIRDGDAFRIGGSTLQLVVNPHEQATFLHDPNIGVHGLGSAPTATSEGQTSAAEVEPPSSVPTLGGAREDPMPRPELSAPAPGLPLPPPPPPPSFPPQAASSAGSSGPETAGSAPPRVTAQNWRPPPVPTGPPPQPASFTPPSSGSAPPAASWSPPQEPQASAAAASNVSPAASPSWQPAQASPSPPQSQPPSVQPQSPAPPQHAQPVQPHPAHPPQAQQPQHAAPPQHAQPVQPHPAHPPQPQQPQHAAPPQHAQPMQPHPAHPPQPQQPQAGQAWQPAGDPIVTPAPPQPAGQPGGRPPSFDFGSVGQQRPSSQPYVMSDRPPRSGGSFVWTPPRHAASAPSFFGALADVPDDMRPVVDEPPPRAGPWIAVLIGIVVIVAMVVAYALGWRFEDFVSG